MEHRKPVKARLVPTELAALAAGATEATIRKWASRGKITRYGTPGRALYDLDEITGILLGNPTRRELSPCQPNG